LENLLVAAWKVTACCSDYHRFDAFTGIPADYKNQAKSQLVKADYFSNLVLCTLLKWQPCSDLRLLKKSHSNCAAYKARLTFEFLPCLVGKSNKALDPASNCLTFVPTKRNSLFACSNQG
jgi:hypothetical protein